jgi:Uma2 family endonuclease
MAMPLNRREFRDWAEGQAGRYERVGGEPVAMSPERIQHARIKARLWAALDAAVRQAGVECEALPGGVTVEVGDDTDYEPDAVVNCGPLACRLGRNRSIPRTNWLTIFVSRQCDTI